MMGLSGYSSEVERQLPKLNVASSILATRSNLFNDLWTLRPDAEDAVGSQLGESVAVSFRRMRFAISMTMLSRST